MKSEGFLPSDLELPAFDAEPPRDPSHGDVAVNAALVLAKPAKKKPRDIADALKAKLEAAPDVEKIDVAGPGFLNITFKNDVWQSLIRTILNERIGLRRRLGQPRRQAQRRIRFGEPDWPDACRPLPRRRLW